MLLSRHVTSSGRAAWKVCSSRRRRRWAGRRSRSDLANEGRQVRGRCGACDQLAVCGARAAPAEHEGGQLQAGQEDVVHQYVEEWAPGVAADRPRLRAGSRVGIEPGQPAKLTCTSLVSFQRFKDCRGNARARAVEAPLDISHLIDGQAGLSRRGRGGQVPFPAQSF